MKRFYLSGQRTFENRGCEALVRSTVMMLNEAFGPCEILVPSDNIARDAAQWPESGDFGVRFVRAYTPPHTRYWVHFQRLPLRFIKQAGWPFPFPRWLKEQLAGVDAVLAIGGDNYSLDYKLPSLWMGIDRLAMDLGTPVYLWGASVGPFEGEKDFLPIIRAHLARMDSISVRESISFDYLTKTLGLTNVVNVADPAFTLIPESIEMTSFWPRDVGAGVIGVNISPLIERYRRKDQNLRNETIDFIRAAVAKGFGVLLVPHVIRAGANGKGNDAEYMSKMFEDLADLGNSVTITPSTLNAAQIKGVVAKLRFFFGARTHATIAALSSCVPTISISYSVKAKGINADIFSDPKMVLKTPDVSCANLLEKLEYLTRNEDNIILSLKNKIPEIRHKSKNSIKQIV